jgi:hypothetical protein
MVMPPRLTEIGDHERPDHYHLPKDAKCFFWGEYTPHENTIGRGWSYSPTNQIIGNFKKRMDRKGFQDWQYKIHAVQDIAKAFAKFWKWDDLHTTHRVALVPIPPSKARHDPAFDSRMFDMVTSIAVNTGVSLDIRDCLSFSGGVAASHTSNYRPTPDELLADLSFDHVIGKSEEQPGVIFLFDDMLTTGAHFQVAVKRLEEFFPGVQIVGNFIARRITPNPFADFDDISGI